MAISRRLLDPLGIFGKKKSGRSASLTKTAVNAAINASNSNKVDYRKYEATLGVNFHDFFSQYATDQNSQSLLRAFDEKGKIDPKAVAALAGNDPKKVKGIISELQSIQSSYSGAAQATRRLDNFLNDPKERAFYLKNAQTPDDVLKQLGLGAGFSADGGRLQTTKGGLGGLATNAFFDQLFDPERNGLDFSAEFAEAQATQIQDDANTAAEQAIADQEAERIRQEAIQKQENIRIFKQYKDIYEQQAADEYDYLTKQLNIELPAIEDALVAQITALDNRIRQYDQQSEVQLGDIEDDFQNAVDNAYTVFDRGKTDINTGFDRNKALLDRSFNRQKVGFENRLDDLRGVARRHRGDTETALNDLMLRNEQTLRSRLISAGLRGSVADSARTFERLEQAERTSNVREDYQSSIQNARQEYDRNLGLATEDHQTAGRYLREDKALGLERNQEDYDNSVGTADQTRFRNLRDLQLADHAQNYLFDEERSQLGNQRDEQKRETQRLHNERIASSYNNLGQQVFNTAVSAGYDPYQAQDQSKDAFDQSRTYGQQAQQQSAPNIYQPGSFVPLRLRTNREEGRQKGRTSNVGQDYR